MLLPVIVFAVMCARTGGKSAGGARPPLLPWFAGLLVVILRSEEVRTILTDLVRNALTVGF